MCSPGRKARQLAITLTELPEQSTDIVPPSADVREMTRVREFEVWYDQSFGRLVGLAALVVGSREAAADLTQDAMVRVMTRWDQLDDPDAYARRAVVNACNSYLRRQSLARRVVSRSRPSRVVLDLHDLTGPLDHRLRKGLADLRVPERTALVLRFWLDLSDLEIAETMGLARGTVSSMLHRGLARLRESVGDV